MRKFVSLFAAAALAVGGVSLVGCGEADTVEPVDTTDTTTGAEGTVDDMGTATEDAAKDVGTATEDAAGRVGDAARSTTAPSGTGTGTGGTGTGTGTTGQ